jgi:hypothetical protein
MSTAATQPNPYVGPRPFETGEKLYGRDREILDLSDLLLYKRFVLLHSPSGAGKSSLIQAGLIPILKQQRLRVTQPPIRVNKEPPKAFMEAGHTYNRYLLSTYISLEEAFPEAQRTPLPELAALSFSAYLALREQKLTALGQADAPGVEVLLFDQFEEVMSLNPHDREAKETFFAQVGEVLHAYRHMALFAMREDYVAGLEGYFQPLPERLGARFRIDLLTVPTALQAIQGPAHDHTPQVNFTDEAARALAKDLCQTSVQQADGSVQTLEGQYVEPVQLQVVCQRLWDARQTPDEITLADLETLRAATSTASGGSEAQPSSPVDQALGDYYAAKVVEVTSRTRVPERAIRNWFDQQLITAQGLRGQVLKTPGSSQGLENTAIDELLNAYLVRKEDRRGLTWFELAHDRLVRPIQANNRQWYAVNLQPFQHKAAAWLSQGRPPTLLLAGRELEDAKNWRGELTPGEIDFIQASREAELVVVRERQVERGINLADLGWGVIFAADASPAIYEALGELLEHRKRQATERRVEYYKEFRGSRGYQRGDDARKFLARYGAGTGPTNPDKMPYYLLIVGDPESIPFEFQYGLDERYAVGRIYFESPEEYASYARSVVLAESGQFSLPKDCLVFYTQHPEDNATYLSAKNLAQPVFDQLSQSHPDWQTRSLAVENATKANLLRALGGPETPTVLFTVSHNMAFPQTDVRHRRHQGAILCQDWPGPRQSKGPISERSYLSSDDISVEANGLGLVAFLWGAYTAGTPRENEFGAIRESGDPVKTEHPFLARLPQRLLGLPKGGALAVIGHVDLAWGHSFLGEGLTTRDFGAIADTLDRLMRGHTVGSAVEALNQRYSNFYAILSNELMQRALHKQSEWPRTLEDMLVRTLDARNYIILGDPAVRLPIDSGPVAPQRPAIEPVAPITVVAEEDVVTQTAEPPETAPPPIAAVAEATRGAESGPEALRLVFNGIDALTGRYLLSLPMKEFAQRILGEEVDRDLLSDLRRSLESRSRNVY